MKIGVLIVFIVLSVPLLGLDQEEKSAIKAIKAGDIAALISYLEKRPDANVAFSNGKTGMDYAIRYNQGRIVRLLIEYGAEADRRDQHLETPLMAAARLDNLEICRILVNRGADPSATNPKGKRASDLAKNHINSATYDYLLGMEKQHQRQDSIPSYHDGPYIYLEAGDRMVVTCFERDRERNLTRLSEKTIIWSGADTVIQGFGRDQGAYTVKTGFTPGPDEIKTTGDIFAIGDLHGRYDALINLLSNNQIIGSEMDWNFGEGHLVLLGDVFDRGGQVTETLWFLYHLQQQARHAGGDVHLLLGNHEVMSMTGDHRYLHDKYQYFTQYTQTDYYRLIERNTVLGRWLRSQHLILRINGNLFLHAGISPQFAIYDFPYSEVNAKVRQYLSTDDQLVAGSPEKIILGPAGPLWYRGYAERGNGLPEVTQDFVDQYLASKGLKRMIVGHNEKKSITGSFAGKVISADVAIDESGASAQGALISGDTIFRCYADGRTEEIVQQGSGQSDNANKL